MNCESWVFEIDMLQRGKTYVSKRLSRLVHEINASLPDERAWLVASYIHACVAGSRRKRGVYKLCVPRRIPETEYDWEAARTNPTVVIVD